VKKILTWLAIGFAVFYVLTAPQDAAGAVRAAAGGLEDAAGSLSEFFSSLV